MGKDKETSEKTTATKAERKYTRAARTWIKAATPENTQRSDRTFDHMYKAAKRHERRSGGS